MPNPPRRPRPQQNPHGGPYGGLTREHVPGYPTPAPYLGISRQVTYIRIVEAICAHSDEYRARYSGDGASKLREHLHDTVMSLPDGDIADLNYLATEGNARGLASHFFMLMRRIRILKSQIDAIPVDGITA